VSLTKSFRIRELVRLRIGGEAFNLFNRHSWQTPGFGQDINGQNYGEIQPVQPFGARAMQLKLRVEW